MEQDLISVIVPVYNVEKYLDECVESIVNQTYSNLEIILVDDGSTDGCPQICDAWAKRDKRIKVIHKLNGGLSDARNVGIDVVKGKYVTFFDSDDIMAYNMIEYMYVKTCEYDELDMVICDFAIVDNYGKKIRGDRRYNDVLLANNAECMYFCMCDKRFDVSACAKLYRSYLFNELRFPYGKYHEDNFLTYKVVAKCKKIVFGGEPLYIRRVRHGSIMFSSFQLKHLDAIEAAKEKVAFMKNNYPMYISVARAGVLSAVNSCLLRLVKSKFNSPETIYKRLQPYYREYLWDYLKGRGFLSSKIFSIFAAINFDVAVWMLKRII